MPLIAHPLMLGNHASSRPTASIASHARSAGARSFRVIVTFVVPMCPHSPSIVVGNGTRRTDVRRDFDVDVGPQWHSCGMSRIRVSTTVDGALLTEAREALDGSTDAVLFDHALRALVASHRRARIDRSYEAYDDMPLTEPDEWGDLASFRSAAAAT